VIELLTSIRKKSFAGLALLLVLSFCSTGLLAQQSDEAAKKKYAPILGGYEFDADGQLMVINFWIEGGELWGGPEGETPSVLTPLEGKEFAFEADVMGQYYEVTFIKNEEGKYTGCVVATMGMEIEGVKINK
jgi:hypothetical protein